MRWTRTLFVLAMAAVLLGIPACGGEKRGSDGKPGSNARGAVTIGFVSNNAASFWTIAQAGSDKAAAEFGVEVLFRRPSTGSAGEQKDIIEDLLTQQIKGIAISVNDPVNQKDFLNRIAEQVPLITQDNDAPGSNRICYIGTDNYEAGKDAGKLVREAMPEGGTIAIFVGKPDPINARERRQGVLDELAGMKDAKGPMYGKYKLLDTYYDYVDFKKAKDNAADVLTKLKDEPNVCLVGLWQYNPPNILSAVKEAGKVGKVRIVAFDEHEDTLRAIADGSMHGTIVQDPYGFGYESVKLLSELARGDRTRVPKDGIMHVKHQIIKKNNVEAFDKQLRERLGQK